MANQWSVCYSTSAGTAGLDDVVTAMHVAEATDGVEPGEVSDDRGDWRSISQELHVSAASRDEAMEKAVAWVENAARGFTEWRSECGLDRDEEFDPLDYFLVQEPWPVPED